MPLVKRAIEPVFVCREQLDSKVKNELEGVVINSLAGVMKQLASLSKHAENLFGDLYSEASDIYTRSAKLSERVTGLDTRIRQLDSTVREDVRIEALVQISHFKSSREEEQKVLSRTTLPTSVEETYKSCDIPPSLNLFTPYRDDQKEGLTFYTDPDYFYRLWVEDQNQQLEKKKKRERKRRRRNKDNQPKKEIKAAQKKVFHGTDIEFRDPSASSSQKVQTIKVSQTSTSEYNAPFGAGLDDSFEASMQQQPQHTPPSGPAEGGGSYNGHPQPVAAQPQNDISKPTHAPPPPPPNPAMMGGSESPKAYPKPVAAPPPPPSAMDTATPPNQRRGTFTGRPVFAPPPPPSQNEQTGGNMNQAAMTLAPPPPPPPPPANIPAPPPPPPELSAPSGGGITTTTKSSAPAAPVYDPRSDLLQAIRLGKELRKVEEQSQVEKKQQTYGNDVASILARRIAFEVSDSESGSDDSDDDEDWSD